MDITFFGSPSEFHDWLENHYATVKELWIGFYKKSAGKAGITYAEAVDEALCFGWIDGLRKSVDEVSYTNRFSPRKPHSIWSTVNLNHVARLSKQGRMQPPGLKAYEDRDQKKQEQYSYEVNARKLDDIYEDRFKANTPAWDFFQGQPASYRKAASWWVVSAKREETKLKRLATLIEISEKGATAADVDAADETDEIVKWSR